MSQSTTISSANPMHMLRAMVGIGALCGLLIVLTYEGTLPRIEQLKAEALQQAIFKVLPGITNTKAYKMSDGTFILTEDQAEADLYAGYDDQGNFKGVAIEASGQGYADIIKVLYGYSPEEQQVIGFYVLESKETPGLGDKIEKDPKFLDNFKAMDVTLTASLEALVNTVVTVKQGTKQNSWEIDGITGATISSRAIGSLLQKSTDEWIPVIYEHQEVFKQANNE
jgi:electron transport complex protein RnfG